MNRAQSRKIERILCSLQESTDLSISLRGETVSFDGLCSPYDSNCIIRVTRGHGIPQLVVFRNSRHSLAVIPGQDFPRYNHQIEGDCFATRFPAFHLFPLFIFPAKRPQWFQGVVTLIVPDTFQGFDDNGNPCFKPWLLSYVTVSCKFYNPDSKSEVDWEVEIVPKLPWQKVGTVGCSVISTVEHEGERYWTNGISIYKEGIPFQAPLGDCESAHYRQAVNCVKPTHDLFPLCHWVKCNEQCDGCRFNQCNWWVITYNLSNPVPTLATEEKIKELGGEIEDA